jgi:hypothetical protein
MPGQNEKTRRSFASASAAVLAILLSMLAHAKEESPDRPATARGLHSDVEEVLVTGIQPGPGMWKVQKGDHTLWILGTYAPLPSQVIWRSVEVQSVILQSREILGPYLAEFWVSGVDPYDLSGAQDLKDVLPADIYARWKKLKNRYIGRKQGRNNWLPASAAVQLQIHAFQSAGLTYDDQVWNFINAMARKHRIKVSLDHQIHKQIRPDLQDLGARVFSTPASITYLVKTMERLETDVADTRARANAWAVGDIAALRSLIETEQTQAYLAALSGPFMTEHNLRDLFQRADEQWISAARTAINNNTTTFSILHISMLLGDPRGLLAGLEEAGCVVEAPLD